jgi:hypothetical protein
MSRHTAVLVALALAVGGASARPVRAGSAEDVGPRIVVPYVAYDPIHDTRVFIQNHESSPVEVFVRYVGEKTSTTPGMQVCQPGGSDLVLPALSITELDVTDNAASGCSLSPPGEQGMLVLEARSTTSLGRLSARARIDVVDTSNPGRRQIVFVDGIPLGQLDTTDTIHVVTNLRRDPGGSLTPSPLESDCFFSTFYDGSANHIVYGLLRLKGKNGAQLGTDVPFKLQPFEMVEFPSVFSLAGAPAGFQDGVRAEFRLTGGGDEVLGFCRTVLDAPTGQSFSYQIAQVAEPHEESRRRIVSVSQTLGVPFSIDPAQKRILHGIYVRHPDIVNCGVSPTTPGALELTAVAPDRMTFFHDVIRPQSTGEFATLGQVYQGGSDLWGLEVTWAGGMPGSAAESYSISCQSGNGTSLADRLVLGP